MNGATPLFPRRTQELQMYVRTDPVIHLPPQTESCIMILKYASYSTVYRLEFRPGEGLEGVFICSVLQVHSLLRDVLISSLLQAHSVLGGCLDSLSSTGTIIAYSMS